MVRYVPCPDVPSRHKPDIQQGATARSMQHGMFSSASMCLSGLCAGKLVECTSLDVCPYATPQYSIALNRTVLVNRAPALMNVALIM